MALTRPRAAQIYDIDYKQATRVVTISNITLAGSAPSSVDGVSLSLNDRILVTGQSTASQNGIYYVTTVGTGSNGTWARSQDTNSTGELLGGTIVMVTEGTVYADTQWKLTTNDPITIGSTALTFVQNYSANSISAGTSNVSVTSNANVTISSAGTPNVLTVSSTGVVVSGTASATGNITGNYFFGNGSQLTGIAPSSTYSNSNVSAFLATFGSNTISTTGTVTAGNITGGNLLTSGLISATGNISTAAQLVSTVATGTAPFVISSTTKVSGLNVEQVDGFDASQSAVANTIVVRDAGGNINTAVLSASGNVTGGNIVATTALTNGNITITGANIVSTGTTIYIDPNGTGGTDGNVIITGNLSVTGNATYINSNNITTNDLTINMANNAATAAAANGGGIEVGPVGAPYVTLTYNSTSNIWVASNGLNVQGILSASGNITGGNISATNHTGTNVSVTGTVTAASTVGGVITGSSSSVTGTQTAASTVGGVITGTSTSVSGAVTAGSIATSGTISTTGNIYTGNILTNGYYYANGVAFTGSGGGGGTPGGANTYIQFNDGGAFNGTAGLTFDKTTNAVVATGNVTGGNIIASNDVYAGPGATTAGFTTAPVFVGRDTAGTYVQSALQNASGNGSADFTAYANNGTEAAGWVDIGFTGNTFNDGNYTVTGANDGYLISQGNASFGGNLVIATGAIGTTKDIVFATGGFLTGNIKARLFNSTGQFSVTGNINGGNLTTTGKLLAGTANITPASQGFGTGLNVTSGDITVFRGDASGAIYVGNSQATYIYYDGTSWSIAGGTGVAVSNLTTTGTVSATGNITGGNLRTAGQVSATGNITSAANIAGANANITTQINTTSVSASGNIRTAGTISATSSVTAASTVGGVITGSSVSVTGAQTAASTVGGVITGSSVSVTGAQTAASTVGGVITGTSVSVSGSVTGGAHNGTSVSVSGGVTAASVSGGVITGTSVSVSGNVTAGGHVGTVYTNSIINTGANATGNIGSATLYFNTAFIKATSAQYADLAEMYTADDNYVPGTVVEFGGDQEVTISSSNHCTQVAGIISTNPSYLMNSAQEGEHVLPVALTGRVPCQVVGTIRKGDRLVSSDLPGVAMALDMKHYEPGCIIGKALENYNSIATGVIEVAVGRF